MLTVLTWFWQQPRGIYRAEHVNIWADMVRHNLSMPHRIACVTELREDIDPTIEIIAPPKDFENVRIPSWGAGKPQCLRRLAMFRRDAGKIFGDRFVCMDLDCVVSGKLDPLFDGEDEFKIFKGTAPSRPYNGSMMLVRAGARPQLYERFTVEDATEAGRHFVGSDQAWISYVLGPNEKTWGPADGVNFWERGRPIPSDTRLMFLPGQFKPWQFVEDGSESWIADRYRRAPRGRCLILGYASNVWDEAAAALDAGAFDAVIASPEAAEHWPGEILAIANGDAQAERLARMHGFDDFVFCGRTGLKQAA